MGYRYLLRRLEYPQTIRPGDMMPVHMWWLTLASLRSTAPTPWPFNSTMKTPAPPSPDRDVRNWLPGDAVFEGTVPVPTDLPAGSHHFRLAMLDPHTRTPAIRLAIEGRQDDGWYDVGRLQVE